MKIKHTTMFQQELYVMVAVTMDLANGQPVSDRPSLQTDRQTAELITFGVGPALRHVSDSALV